MDTDQTFKSAKELREIIKNAPATAATPATTVVAPKVQLTPEEITACIKKCKEVGGEEETCKRNCGFVTVNDGKKHYSDEFVPLTKLKESTQDLSCVDRCKLYGGNDATCAADCSKKEKFCWIPSDCTTLVNRVAIISAIVIVGAIGYKLMKK